MRISPIFTQRLSTKSSMTGIRPMQNAKCEKPCGAIRNNDYDIFVGLAEASLKDAKIENELKSMGLI